MINRVFLVSLILVSLSPNRLFADDQVRSVQEELRRRNLYFGDIDGRESSETDEAVKRYQKRKGLKTVGARDSETLRSLGLAGRGDAPPKDLEWPDEPVLRSDLTINVAEAANELAQETGVAPASIVGEKLLSSSPSGRRGKNRPTGAVNESGSAGPRGSASGEKSAVLTPAELRKFVQEFLAAAGGSKLRNELRFYADRLDYYNNRQIDRRLVERGLQRYHERWPDRSYRLGDSVDTSFDPRRGEIVFTYMVSFTLKGHGKRVSGWTRNRMVINAATSDPRIIAIEERRGR